MVDIVKFPVCSYGKTFMYVFVFHWFSFLLRVYSINAVQKLYRVPTIKQLVKRWYKFSIKASKNDNLYIVGGVSFGKWQNINLKDLDTYMIKSTLQIGWFCPPCNIWCLNGLFIFPLTRFLPLYSMSTFLLPHCLLYANLLLL